MDTYRIYFEVNNIGNGDANIVLKGMAKSHLEAREMAQSQVKEPSGGFIWTTEVAHYAVGPQHNLY